MSPSESSSDSVCINEHHTPTTTTGTPIHLLPHRSFVACDPKVLRVALSSFYDMLSVALRTLQEFDDGEEEDGDNGGMLA